MGKEEHEERLTNVCFANNIMLRAKSCDELIYIVGKSDLGAGRHWLAVEFAENKVSENRFVSEPCNFLEMAGCCVAIWVNYGKLFCGDLFKRNWAKSEATRGISEVSTRELLPTPQQQFVGNYLAKNLLSREPFLVAPSCLFLLFLGCPLFSLFRLGLGASGGAWNHLKKTGRRCSHLEVGALL